MADIEQTYFLRSFLLLVEGGTYIAKAIFTREHNKTGRDLDSLLNEFKTKLKHEFHGKQFLKLFPDSGISTDINTWDLQLLIGVITILFRKTISRSEKKDLLVLKHLRNEVFMHCAKASLDADKYEEVIEELEDTLNGLASTFENCIKDVCFTFIKKFKSGPLDALRPSSATLNGLSQTCQQIFKVGVSTILSVDGPSEEWKNLCEAILLTVLNNAISIGESEEYKNVEKKVLNMLDFLIANKDIVFKECRRECIVLEFECGSYEDMLYLLNQFDCWKYRYHLNKIANALTKTLELNCLVTISGEVSTECLQSILITYIKMIHEEQADADCIEVTAESHNNENEEKTQLIQHQDKKACVNDDIGKPLKLEMECASQAGLMHILNSFKGNELQLHLKDVADALSKHTKQKITLKTSLNIKGFMLAFEETVIAKRHFDRESFDYIPDSQVIPAEIQQRPCETEPEIDEEIIEETIHKNLEGGTKQREQKTYIILFRGIHPETCRGALSSVMHETTNGVVEFENIIFNRTKTSAVVKISLSQRPDLDKIRETLRQISIDDERPDVHELSSPDTIAVSTEEGIDNIDCLEYYFESPKICGHELIQGPYLSEDESCVILHFGDPEVVEDLCTRTIPFIWERMELRISPCYIFEDEMIWDTETHNLPKTIIIKLDKNVSTLFQRKGWEQLEAELKANRCVSKLTEKGIELSYSRFIFGHWIKRPSKEWMQSSEQIVDKFIRDNVTENAFKVDKDVWKDIVLFLQSEEFKEHEVLVTSVDDIRFVIHFIGFRQSLENLCAILEEKQNELNQKAELLPFETQKIRLMRSCGVFEEVKLEMGKIEITFEENQADIFVKGEPDDLVKVKLKLYEVSNRIVKRKRKHNFSKACVGFIQGKLKDELTSHLKSMYRSNFVEWEIDLRDITVYTFEEVNLTGSEEKLFELTEHNYAAEEIPTSPEDILKAAVVEIREILPVSCNISRLETFLKNLNDTVGEHVETQYLNKDELMIYGTKEEVQIVRTKIKEFQDKSPVQVVERVIEQDIGNLRFLQKYKKEKVLDLEKKNEVKIDIEDKRVIVTGIEDGVMKTEQELNAICSEIICDTVTVQKVGVKVALLDDKNRMQLNLEETNDRCIIHIPDVHTAPTASGSIYIDSSDEFKGSVRSQFNPNEDQEHLNATSSEAVSEKNDSFETANGIKITLVKGELGEQTGDVIVAGTSHNLNLRCGNACKSLLMKGGESLQTACNRNYPDGIQSDELAVIKSCGNLTCQNVYLTTLPYLTSSEETKECFKRVMKRSLELASDQGMQSIVFSALGTGQLNYPKDLVAFLMFDAVVTFDRCHPKTKLKDVRFVLYTKDYATIEAFEEEDRLRKENRCRKQHIYDLKAAEVTIQVCVGDITAQNVDAVISSSSSNIAQGHNPIIDTLFDKGGEIFKDECQSKYNFRIGMDYIAELGAGNLPYKTVYIASIIGDTYDQAKEHLKEVIRRVLYEALIKGCLSLAIPALLKDDKGHQFIDVCTLLFDTVIEWANENPDSALKTVKFVVDPKDTETITRFKSYVLNAKGIGRRPGRNYENLQKPMSEPGLSLGKVMLRIHKGDILEEQSDAIVASVGKDFASIGSVAVALKVRCPDLELDYRRDDFKHKLNTEHVVVTEVKGLNAKSVIHIRFADNLKDWQYRMRKCLELANEKSYSSVSFSVLGTGKGFQTFSAEDIVGCLFEAVREFEQTQPSPTLCNVNLIVYEKQPGMYSQIIKKFQTFEQELRDETLIGEKQISSRLKELRQSTLIENHAKEENYTYASAKQWLKVVEETSSVDIRVYSDDKDNLKRCKIMLEENIEKMFIERRLDIYKETVKSLNHEQIREINMIALSNIKIDQQTGLISVYGPREDVRDVINEIRIKILNIMDKKPEFDAAEKLYHTLQWHYEEVTTTGFRIVPYKKHLNYRIEQAYRANLQYFMFEENSECFLIDFQQFVEYRKLDVSDRIRVMRKDIVEVPKDLVGFEDKWFEYECEDIEQSLLSGERLYEYRNIFEIKEISIIKVQKIRIYQNHEQYLEQRRQIMERRSKFHEIKEVEQDLWYAASPNEVSDILMYGFNTCYCGRVSPLHGEGVYFTADAAYAIRRWLSSAGSYDKGYMFLCKVLTGYSCPGQKGTRFLQDADISKSSCQYDSAVDDLTDPKEFIVFKDTQICPRYLIIFQYAKT